MEDKNRQNSSQKENVYFYNIDPRVRSSIDTDPPNQHLSQSVEDSLWPPSKRLKKVDVSVIDQPQSDNVESGANCKKSNCR